MKKALVTCFLIGNVLLVASCAVGDKELVVKFTGNECSYSGPAELPIGEHTFALYNESEFFDIDMWVLRFRDGKTMQDALALQGEPGKWLNLPQWMVDTVAIEQDRKKEDGGEDWTFSLDRAGDYVVETYSLQPLKLWYCAPLTVIESPSE